jgi:NAD(P)-dependent dehydrogenase (short-subunit alcohol dehydrogenase family)
MALRTTTCAVLGAGGYLGQLIAAELCLHGNKVYGYGLSFEELLKGSIITQGVLYLFKRRCFSGKADALAELQALREQELLDDDDLKASVVALALVNFAKTTFSCM